MASLLLLTPDPYAIGQIDELAEKHKIRFRSVSDPEKAKEWFKLQAFDVLLVDSYYEGSIPIDIITLAWQFHPLTVAGIFSFTEELKDTWNAKLLGAQLFSGPQAIVEIEKTLRYLPTDYSFAEKQHVGVLVVEDLDSPRDIICAYLESLGYAHVRGVASAEQALEVLHEDPLFYFAVVSDINMPNVSGIELIKAIRSRNELDYLPVIALTAYATSEHLLECVKAGATGFLVKPPKKEKLRKELEKAKRIVFSMQSPRLCNPEDSELLEESLSKII